jgi:hypothetical protein
VSAAAYSKPVSALQRSISYFSALFRATISSNHVRASSYEPSDGVRGTENVVAAFVSWCFYFARTDHRPDMSAASHNHPPARKISVFGRQFTMPRSRGLRIAIGVVLIFGGILGFLPILGFWMIPIGLLVLSYEFALVRRHRRRLVVWWERRRRPN